LAEGEGGVISALFARSVSLLVDLRQEVLIERKKLAGYVSPSWRTVCRGDLLLLLPRGFGSQYCCRSFRASVHTNLPAFIYLQTIVDAAFGANKRRLNAASLTPVAD
jgi:hypothetical protein